jgi:hypothetical protein
MYSTECQSDTVVAAAKDGDWLQSVPAYGPEALEQDRPADYLPDDDLSELRAAAMEDVGRGAVPNCPPYMPDIVIGSRNAAVLSPEPRGLRLRLCQSVLAGERSSHIPAIDSILVHLVFIKYSTCASVNMT